MKNREEAKEQVRQVLMQVPFAVGCEAVQDTRDGFLVRYELQGGTVETLEAVVLAQAYPAVVLRTLQARDNWQGHPLVVSPFISQDAVKLCAQLGASCLDFAGNCRVSFGQVYIAEGGHRNKAVRKPRRPAIFSTTTPISSTILRRLVHDVEKPWKLKDLSQTLGCSIGLVHKVKTFLCDNLWAETTPQGIRLSHVDGLMQAWAREYAAAPQGIRRFHTDLTPEQLEWRVNEVRSLSGIRCWFTGAWAAAHYAQTQRPAVSHGHIYPFRVGDFARECGLTEVAEGGNVVLHLIEQPATLADSVEQNGSLLVSPAQMYLDAVDDATRELALRMIEKR